MYSKKRHTIQYKGLVGPQRSIALSEVYAIIKTWLRLTVSFEKIWGKRGKFDNSIRKAQQTRVWYFSRILNRVQII
jgi:hypothetical protein